MLKNQMTTTTMAAHTDKPTSHNTVSLARSVLMVWFSAREWIYLRPIPTGVVELIDVDSVGAHGAAVHPKPQLLQVYDEFLGLFGADGNCVYQRSIANHS